MVEKPKLTRAEIQKRYRTKHPEAAKASWAKYYARVGRTPAHRARRRRWEEKNRVKLAAKQRAYYQKNVHHYRDYVTAKNRRRRIEVLMHYSQGRMCCDCCGETIEAFLTLDHVNQDGAAHRRAIGGTKAAGSKTYHWLIKSGFPAGYRVLCFNCNCGRHKTGGICPHNLPNSGSIHKH
jgi:hypothetical protein